MRIDLNPGVQPTDPAESSKTSLRSPADAEKSEVADTATFSADYVQAQSLAGTVKQLPELRQDKVAALSAAVRNGTYSVTPAQTAGAVLAYMAGSDG
jgi:flagellar biosynthesis anti-sigma factor FlgM